MKKLTIVYVVLATLFSLGAYGEGQVSKEDEIATLRQGIPLRDEQIKPAALQNASNKDLKRGRAYPMQPPTIPHKIDNYQVDLKVNTCLSCHSRTRVQESQATMISVTHFMDRDGNFLAEVSPRRYFCGQCHVTQVERKNLVNNNFKDLHDILTKNSPAQEARK